MNGATKVAEVCKPLPTEALTTFEAIDRFCDKGRVACVACEGRKRQCRECRGGGE